MTSILSVEDDPLQAEWIRETLLRNFPGIELQQIRTEYEFICRFGEITANPPNLILLDVMLRWTDPAPDMPPRPEEVREEGHAKAGVRCLKRLSSNERTSAVPVILYTVLQSDRWPPLAANVRHVQKDSNSQELIRAIKQTILPERPDLPS